MSYNRGDLRTLVAQRSVMDEDSTDDKVVLHSAINQAFYLVQAFYPSWWFLESEFALTVVANSQYYNFPTTDYFAATVVLNSILADTARTAAKDITWIDRGEIDATTRDWLGKAGTPTQFTLVGKRFVLDRVPDATWTASNPTIWFAGYKSMSQFTWSGSDDTAETHEIPDEWLLKAVVPLAAEICLRYQGHIEEANNQNQIGNNALIEMRAKCIPARRKDLQPNAPSVWNLAGRRTVNVSS